MNYAASNRDHARFNAVVAVHESNDFAPQLCFFAESKSAPRRDQHVGFEFGFDLVCDDAERGDIGNHCLAIACRLPRGWDHRIATRMGPPGCLIEHGDWGWWCQW